MLGGLGVALGAQDFLNINMLVFLMQNRHIGCLNARPQHEWICIAVEYRLSSLSLW